jgi:hypothetical protein
LGFASVLGEFGLPDDTFVAALIGFNVGVEVGQLAVIAAMFFFVWQSLRIDRGENEVARGLGLYALFGLIGLGLLAVNAGDIPTVLGNPIEILDMPALLFALTFAVMSVLCTVSIVLRDQLESYRRFVAVPASVVIAAIGLYWFFERSYGTITGA